MIDTSLLVVAVAAVTSRMTNCTHFNILTYFTYLLEKTDQKEMQVSM